MTKKEMPAGFPLSPRDAGGNVLVLGVLVTVRSVESCKNGLPVEDQERLMALVGQKRKIVQFDRFGFVWLSFAETENSEDFCLFPSEVSLA
ncbi:hypothetical protein [Sulfurifustis variabilis]|nr:hypothetical protein [Sulfurifustis variabilis]